MELCLDEFQFCSAGFFREEKGLIVKSTGMTCSFVVQWMESVFFLVVFYFDFVLSLV